MSIVSPTRLFRISFLCLNLATLLFEVVTSLPVDSSEQMPEFGFPQDDLHDMLDVYGRAGAAGGGAGGGAGGLGRPRLDLVGVEERFQKAKVLLKELNTIQANRMMRGE